MDSPPDGHEVPRTNRPRVLDGEAGTGTTGHAKTGGDEVPGAIAVEPKVTSQARTTPTVLRAGRLAVTGAIPRCKPRAGDDHPRNDSWTWDTPVDCDLPAVFVCHHCHLPVCDRHAYWIPDPWFPVMRTGRHDRTAASDAQKQKLGKVLFLTGIVAFFTAAGLGVLSTIFFIFTGIQGSWWMTRLAVGFLVAACIVVGGAVACTFFGARFKKATSTTRAPYPRYKRTLQTKFGDSIVEYHEHVGFFNAVHCWSCLAKQHPAYPRVAREIIHEAMTRARAWQSPAEEPWTGEDIARIGTWAANHFLQAFKFEQGTWMMPTHGVWPLRVMVAHAPAEMKNKRHGAVQAWFFQNRATKDVDVSRDAFIERMMALARHHARST